LKDGRLARISREVAACARELGRGDGAALARLYDVAAKRLLRYAETVTRNREDAEDAVQAALVRVAERPRYLANARHPWPYFLQMTRNEAIRIVEKKRPLRTISAPLEVASFDDPTIERDERNRRVREALNRLPPEQAEVVILKLWEQMTFLEIGVVLGESANTAASRYRYALLKLSRSLQKVSGEVRHG